MTDTKIQPTVVAGQGISCQPFDNSGRFTCKAGEDGAAREAVHYWTHPTSGESGYFCPRHSPFDYQPHALQPIYVIRYSNGDDLVFSGDTAFIDMQEEIRADSLTVTEIHQEPTNVHVYTVKES
jgi:hypothetical protein